MLPPAILLLILAAVAVWSLFRTESAPPPYLEEPRAAAPPPRALRVGPPARAEAPAARPLEHTQEHTDDDKPYMPPGPNDPHPKTYAHPHPITPEHQRIFRENALLFQLNEAMDGKEVARLRRYLQEYRHEYPEDPHEMQSGYELIADCLEHPGDRTRAAAQKYFNEETASTLRRFVLRHCLTPRQ